MLQFLRNSVGSIFVKILFAFLVLSFGIWGMGDIFTGGFLGNTIAEVGSVKIGAQEIDVEYRRELNRLRGMNIDPERARQLGVLDRVVQGMVNRATFDAEARDNGLTASDATVASEIRETQAFRGNLGSFDRLQFEQILRANGLTEEMYVAELRSDIARNQALGSISSTIQIPKSLADTLFSWREQKRIAAVTNIPIDKTLAVSEPSTTQLLEFHKTNEAEFTAPERRSVRYIYLSAAELAKNITIGEDELVAAFESRKQEFATRETRDVLQMVVSDEAQAKTAKLRLDAGEDFAAVAKDIAGQTAESINLGEITKNDIPADLSGTVFSLANGAMSAPIKGPFGWHLFKVNKINPFQEAKLADIRDVLSKELSNEKAVDEVYSTANKLEDAIGAGSSLDVAASSLGLKLHRISALDAAGRDAAGKPIADLPAAPFVETVFSSGTDDAGTLIETQDGSFFIANVLSITPAKLQPLDDVRDRAILAWKREERVRLAEIRAKAVAEALEKGQALSEIPEANGQTLVPTIPFTRHNGAAQTNLPFNVVNQIFSFKKASKVALGRTGDRFVLAKLTEIQAPEPAKDVETYRGLAQNLRSTISSDILFQYNRALQIEHGVSINTTRLNQVFSDDSGYGGANR